MKDKKQKILIMISAVSEILKLKNKFNLDDEPTLMKAFSSFLKTIKDRELKILAIASAAKTISVIQKEKRLNDKGVLKKVVEGLPFLLRTIEEENYQKS